jgi:hypothetical protein
MERVIAAFDAARRGERQAAAGDLAGIAPLGFCDGYWRGEAGIAAPVG